MLHSGTMVRLVQYKECKIVRFAIQFNYPCRIGKRENTVKIAVSSTGPALSDLLDPRFGRCSYYLIIDSDTMEFEAVRNAGSRLR